MRLYFAYPVNGEHHPDDHTAPYAHPEAALSIPDAGYLASRSNALDSRLRRPLVQVVLPLLPSLAPSLPPSHLTLGHFKNQERQEKTHTHIRPTIIAGHGRYFRSSPLPKTVLPRINGTKHGFFNHMKCRSTLKLQTSLSLSLSCFFCVSQLL